IQYNGIGKILTLEDFDAEKPGQYFHFDDALQPETPLAIKAAQDPREYATVKAFKVDEPVRAESGEARKQWELDLPKHDFDDKGYDLPSLDNLLKYCEKLETIINKFYYNGDIEAGKLYTQENFTFSKNIDGRIRFHYEKTI
ncbi:19219_t:CDS:2, partial [Racocetra persica]